MPTELENAKFMFQVLQFSNATGFNYKVIGDACNISAGAANKRMSRLKQAVKAGKETGLDVRFLWSCIQNSDMGTINFQTLGAELNLSAGAASKRWSRLKQTLERGEMGAPAPSKGGGAAGKKETGAGSGAGRKRKAAEAENDEGDGSVAKKGKNDTAASSKIKNEDDDNDAAELTKPATSNKKAAVRKAAATGPKKAVSKDVREVKSTPPRRRNLTDMEVYAKLGVDDAEQEIKTERDHAYPPHHSLLQTFQALQTPGRASAGASIFRAAAPQSEATSYPTPEDSAEGSNERTAYDVFTTISEEAMKSPSGAERRLQREKEAEWDNELDRTANMQNPFVAFGEDSVCEAAVNTSFFSADEPGDDEEYC
ncbi:putative mannan endo-alpha-mannosidase dcw1 [Neofusicoccum parvum]|uniref:Mannan endo-alpha-mannosidase dcw1 n=1 Tax=Neofusicoccum parvum TaxID=310453 RepID=A0ACB5S374_9PEZI|nr:putative mannan endo-alpha-mannosidase dcw1 [Neofusicoccum parvum]